MIDYHKYPQFNKVEEVRDLASTHLKTINWREIKHRLSEKIKDPEGTYVWWYSRGSKNNKVFHDSNSRTLIEDIEYAEGSGHFNIEIRKDGVDELENFNPLLPSINGLNYAGVFFIGPNSFVESHTDDGMYNILITVKSAKDAFLTIEGENFYFEDNEIFMFDGDLEHSATNTTNNDWILAVLRINKSEFQI